MTLTRLLLLGITASSLVSAAGQCSGTIGTVASLVSTMSAAQSFCTSKYPLPLVTITTTVGTSTISTTVATNIVTTTTVAATATTVVATNTVLTTSTIYQKKKRATISNNIKAISTTATMSTSSAKTTFSTTSKATTTSTTKTTSSTLSTVTTQNAQASALSSLSAAANAVAASICTCIETPLTTTSSVTATTVTSITATQTITTDTTRTISITTTVTNTATATACAVSFPGSATASDGRVYGTRDDTFIYGPVKLGTTYPDDLTGCLDDCEQTTGCRFVTWSPNYGYCELVADGDICQGGSSDFISGRKS